MEIDNLNDAPEETQSTFEELMSQALLIELLNQKKLKFLRMSFFRVNEDITLRT